MYGALEYVKLDHAILATTRLLHGMLSRLFTGPVTATTQSSLAHMSACHQRPSKHQMVLLLSAVRCCWPCKGSKDQMVSLKHVEPVIAASTRCGDRKDMITYVYVVYERRPCSVSAAGNLPIAVQSIGLLLLRWLDLAWAALQSASGSVISTCLHCIMSSVRRVR